MSREAHTIRQRIRAALQAFAYPGRQSSRPLSCLLRLLSLMLVALTATTSGCGSAPVRGSSRMEQPQVSKAPIPAQRSRGGGYYLDDGPGDSPPADLEAIKEPIPQLEPLHRAAMRPYVVMGQTYTPMTELSPYKARGVASWYGRRYHGKQTSTGEVYDMYRMTAAHPVLPLPSYVRVTNVATGKSVVVRVNDRGPFIDSRLIDLSYSAAHRLGVLAGGSAVVDVEAIIPEDTPPSTAVATVPVSNGRAAANSLIAGNPAAAAEASRVRMTEDPIASIAAAARDDKLSVSTPDSQTSQPVVAQSPQTTSGDAAGVYLQLAAFGSRTNAESYLARAKVQVEWLAQVLHLFARDGLYRIHAGPYASSSEAREAAERIGLAVGAKPLIVTR
ncbi:MAG: rare lipoprotein [Betaproteobacteria bacterium]